VCEGSCGGVCVGVCVCALNLNLKLVVGKILCYRKKGLQ